MDGICLGSVCEYYFEEGCAFYILNRNPADFISPLTKCIYLVYTSKYIQGVYTLYNVQAVVVGA